MFRVNVVGFRFQDCKFKVAGRVLKITALGFRYCRFGSWVRVYECKLHFRIGGL